MMLFGKTMELEDNGRGERERKLLLVGEANITSYFFFIIYCSSIVFLSITVFVPNIFIFLPFLVF